MKKTAILKTPLIIIFIVLSSFALINILPHTYGQNETCDMIADNECTKNSYLPHITSDITEKGCTSTQYTGREINNPLRIEIKGDSNKYSKGAIVWLSESNNTPEEIELTNETTSTYDTDIAVLILQKNNSWNNEPDIYSLRKNGTFGILDSTKNFVISNTNSTVTVTIEDIKESPNGTSFKFSLSFNSVSDTSLSKTYNFKASAVYEEDLNNDKINISNLERKFNWNIDLKDPLMEKPQQLVLGPQELDLNISTQANGSALKHIVVNAYKLGDLSNGTLSLINPLGYPILPVEEVIPTNERIGNILGTYAQNTWQIPIPSSQEYISTWRLNIGLSEGGAIVMYTSIYDNACNYTTKEHKIDLIPWIATKGGVIYTQGSFSHTAKNVSQVPGLESSIRNIPKEELTTATELIASRSNMINSLLYSENTNAVRVTTSIDSNKKDGFWFAYFKRRLDINRDNFQSFSIKPTDIKVSDSCLSNSCLFYSTEDIHIRQNFSCDRNTLIMSEANIYLNPDIREPENISNTTGCLFISNKNIVIEQGERKSTSEDVGYDYIEGFLIAENNIDIKVADENDIVRDALEIKGGLVAIGKNSQGIILNRNIRLFNYSQPTLVLLWDIKYARLSEIFFGVDAPIYKEEVGFKSI